MLLWWSWGWLAVAATPVEVSPLQPLSGPADGEVTIEVQVSPSGFLERVEVVESCGYPHLDQAAMEQVLQASWTAARDDEDRPVRSAATLSIPVVGPDTADGDTMLVFDSDEEIVVEAAAAVDVSEVVVTLEDIRYLPGSGGDVVRTVQNLPGVARPPFNLGQLLIRGTAPEDSGYFLDGMRIPIVFHFGGISTVINGDFLDEVRFRSGGYGVRYGGLLGGVVDLRASGDLPERSRAYASLDLFQATGFAEVLVGRTAFTVSARRSYIDAVLQPVLDNQVEQPVQAPRFWDTQLRVQHDPVGPEKVDVLLVMSDDKFLVFGEDDAASAEGADDIDLAIGIRFTKGRFRYTREGPGPWRGELTVQAGPELQTFEVAPAGVAEERGVTGSLRAELERTRGDDPVGVLLGVESRLESVAWEFDVPTFGAPDKGEALAATASAYGELVMGLGPIELTSGARADVRATDGPSLVGAVDPRAQIRWAVDPSTDVEASVGRYSQFPTLRQLEPFSSRDLGALSSNDGSIGVRRDLGSRFDVRATGFTKQLSRLVVGRQDSFEFFTTPPQPGPIDNGVWANEGRGSVWGIELQVRARTARTVGWISATLSKSRRIDRRDAERYVFDYDQPVNLVALASHELDKGWRVGGRARLASGTPYTAVARTNFANLEGGALVPVFGPRNGARLQPYFALDLRVDKEFVFPRWVLATYLDLTNVTNRSNQELMAFTPNLEEQPIRGLPIVPAFGIRADF